MNNLLNDNDYKKLTEFNLLLRKSKSHDFEYYVLSLLNDIFDFNFSTFFTYSDSGFVEDVVGYNVTDSLIQDYINFYQKKDLIIEYLNKHQYTNQTEQIIVLTDIYEEGGYKNIEYYDFLINNDLYYNMALIINPRGDGIRILRKKEKGKFTDRERQIAHYICEIFSSQYQIIQENRKLKDEIELFNKSKENMHFGFMIFDKDLKLINLNKLALKYSFAITGKYMVDSLIDEFKKIINEEIKEEFFINPTNSSIYKSIKSYILEVIPSTSIEDNNMINTYYMVYIYDKSWFEQISNKFVHVKEEFNLTTREQEIVSLVIKGLSNKDIADNLCISIYTVKKHMKNIFRKMNVTSRSAIISKTLC